MGYDILHGSDQDLLCREVQDEVFMLTKSRAILGVGAALVCSSVSRAITPSWRSSTMPYGKPGLTESQQKKVDDGNFQVLLSLLEGWRPLLGREPGYFIHMVHPGEHRCHQDTGRLGSGLLTSVHLEFLGVNELGP